MINERYQVSGVPVGSRDRITGWLWKNKGYYISNGTHDLCEIDPDTIEPVKVKAKEKGNWGECPNFGSDNLQPYADNYCNDCGMALDWSE